MDVSRINWGTSMQQQATSSFKQILFTASLVSSLSLTSVTYANSYVASISAGDFSQENETGDSRIRTYDFSGTNLEGSVFFGRVSSSTNAPAGEEYFVEHKGKVDLYYLSEEADDIDWDYKTKSVNLFVPNKNMALVFGGEIYETSSDQSGFEGRRIALKIGAYASKNTLIQAGPVRVSNKYTDGPSQDLDGAAFQFKGVYNHGGFFVKHDLQTQFVVENLFESDNEYDENNDESIISLDYDLTLYPTKNLGIGFEVGREWYDLAPGDNQNYGASIEYYIADRFPISIEYSKTEFKEPYAVDRINTLISVGARI